MLGDGRTDRLSDGKTGRQRVLFMKAEKCRKKEEFLKLGLEEERRKESVIYAMAQDESLILI